MTRIPTLVLASASPRRSSLLSTWGIPFRVMPARGVDESAAKGSAVEVARRLAAEKAEAVLRDLTVAEPPAEVLVVGADTVVEVGGELLGKPEGRDDARRMLRSLSGRAHRVVTGLALATRGRPTRVESEESRVEFRALAPEEIEAYLDTRDWEGKAGAYGIQSGGRSLIAGFHGCYYNIVGLPLRRLSALLAAASPGAPRSLLECGCGQHALQLGAPGCAGPAEA